MSVFTELPVKVSVQLRLKPVIIGGVMARVVERRDASAATVGREYILTETN